uniref:Uncharacterized protein n=1 Tax=Romanomermis culicivorax TaxID=13658 RepID=A0A915ID99_ROMCU
MIWFFHQCDITDPKNVRMFGIKPCQVHPYFIFVIKRSKIHLSNNESATTVQSTNSSLQFGDNRRFLGMNQRNRRLSPMKS